MLPNKPNLIADLSFSFALKIITYVSILENNKKYVIAKQLLRSGTGIGANIRESQNAESRADFIHKIKIAIKEAEETEYWLLLCNASEGYENCAELIELCRSIIKVLAKIISTAKANINR